MAIAGAASSTRASVERGVLDVVAALAAELGTAPPRAVALDDVLDRDLGFGSLERVELALRLEQAFGVRLGDTVMAEAERCADVVDAVLAAQPIVAEPLHPAPAVGPGPAAPASARTLVEVLRWHAERSPDRVHIVLRREDGTEQPITHGELWRDALRDAAGLRACGVSGGDNVALMLRTEPAFFSVFFAILLAGGVPVPIYLRSGRRASRNTCGVRRASSPTRTHACSSRSRRPSVPHAPCAGACAPSAPSSTSTRFAHARATSFRPRRRTPVRPP